MVVDLRIRRGWVVLEGVAALMAAVLAGAELGGGDWLTGVLLAVLCASFGFQVAQGWGALRIDGSGIEDDRVLGAGTVDWSGVEGLRVGEGGWFTPPLRLDVSGRARPVVASAPWTLAVRLGGEPADWPRAREAVVSHARRAGVEVSER